MHLEALRSLSGVRVAALADGGSGRVQKIAADWPALAGGPPVACRDGRDLIERPDIDLIVVAAPPSTQCSLVVAAVEAGKSVLCEKPFGATLEEAELMARVAEGRPGAFAVAFQYRYELQPLIDALAASDLGSLHRIDVSWLVSRSGSRQSSPWRAHERHGNVLSEFGSHVLDYLTVLARGPITDIRRMAASDGRAELAVAIGAVACHVSLSNVEPEALGHRITIHGQRGRLVYHRRPPYRSHDLRLWWEHGGARHEMPCHREAAAECASDSRTPATRSLFSDCIAAMNARRNARLPTFLDGLRMRQALAHIDY